MNLRNSSQDLLKRTTSNQNNVPERIPYSGLPISSPYPGFPFYPMPILPSVYCAQRLNYSVAVPSPYPEEQKLLSLIPPQEFFEQTVSVSADEREEDRGETEFFQCTKCGKLYLSLRALYTHNKTKHPETRIKAKPKRGKPKKKVLLFFPFLG